MMEQNIAVTVTTDPNLVKRFFSRLEESIFKIPQSVEAQYDKHQVISSSDKGVLVSRVTSPEDYQKQLALIAMVQHSLDRVQELNSMMYGFQHRLTQLHKEATRYLNITYFSELDALRDGVRKSILSSALQPIEERVETAEFLIKKGEKIYSHLINTNWNLKEGDQLIKEYLTTLKYSQPTGGSASL